SELHACGAGAASAASAYGEAVSKLGAAPYIAYGSGAAEGALAVSSADDVTAQGGSALSGSLPQGCGGGAALAGVVGDPDGRVGWPSAARRCRACVRAASTLGSPGSRVSARSRCWIDSAVVGATCASQSRRMAESPSL